MDSLQDAGAGCRLQIDRRPDDNSILINGTPIGIIIFLLIVVTGYGKEIYRAHRVKAFRTPVESAFAGIGGIARGDEGHRVFKAGCRGKASGRRSDRLPHCNLYRLGVGDTHVKAPGCGAVGGIVQGQDKLFPVAIV